MGNVGIYSVGAESVYQIVQSDRTECLTGVSREDIIREIQLSPSVLTLRIPLMWAHTSFRGMLSREILAKTLLA